MKIAHYNAMMKELTKPPSPYTKEERKQMVKDFYKEREAELNKKAEQSKPKPLGIVPYIQTMNRLYGSDGGNNVANADQLKEKKEAKWKYTSRMDEIEEEEKIDPKEFEDIKKSLPVSELVKKEETPKKKIIKKTLIVEKPKPVKPPVISLLELEDWLNEVDPNTWTEEESKKEVLLRVPRRSLRGLASILNLHKRST